MSRPFVPILSWISKELSAFLRPLWSSRTSVPMVALTRFGLWRLLAGDCHCCSDNVLIFQFALVQMVVGHLELSWKSYCSTQDSWEVATGAEYTARGVGMCRLLTVCQFLGILGYLLHVLTKLKNYLTFKINLPITPSISNLANLKQNCACLLSLCRDRGTYA